MVLVLGQRWLTCSTDILATGCAFGKGFVQTFGKNLLTFAAT
jgi:hypothetical protein